jgi:plastocyanin
MSQSFRFIIGLMTFAIVLPTLAIASDGSFRDVPADAWFFPYVRSAVDAGIVSGYENAAGYSTGYFGPEKNVTVGEALKIVLLGAGYDTSRGIGYGHWAAKYLSVALGEHFEVAQEPGINLDRPATRSELASLTGDAFRVQLAQPIGTVFKDVPSAVRFSGAIETLTLDGILSGDTDTAGNPTGSFRPAAPVNRAETVKIVMAARAYYGQPGNRPVSSSSFSSSSSIGSSSGVCTPALCGPGPQMPNWLCQDGSVAGPSCIRLSNGQCGWLIRQCPYSSSSSSSSSRPYYTYDINYINSGFQPSFIAVRTGDTVRFTNRSGLLMWIASNPYPNDSDYPEFNQRATVGTGATFSFTFQRAGVFGFHNQMQPSHQGVIEVDQ